jgi:hypothetical protein
MTILPHAHMPIQRGVVGSFVYRKTMKDLSGVAIAAAYHATLTVLDGRRCFWKSGIHVESDHTHAIGYSSHSLAYQKGGIVWTGCVALHIVVAENRTLYTKQAKISQVDRHPMFRPNIVACCVPEARRGYPWILKPLDTSRRVAGATLDADTFARACSVNVRAGHASCRGV